MEEILELFPKNKIIGVFRGFQQGGLEFHADLVLPYQNEFQNIPMHGQFLLVQLESPDEAVLGRITSFSSSGKLSSGSGEEFNIRAVKEDRTIPEDLREQYLKYQVNIRILGVLRKRDENLTFVPSHRRLPHVGSKVAFPSSEVIREIAGHNIEGETIGHFALGEFIHASPSEIDVLDWMQITQPDVKVKFNITSLISRRSFIFARAGFGKSNLNKLLFSELYRKIPRVNKKNGKTAPVATIIFDPDGEYFWPDDKGRPGLCDVPHLEDKLVVFSKRENPSKFYQSFVSRGLKLDIREFAAKDILPLALDSEKLEQQNIKNLLGTPKKKWKELVDLISVDLYSTDIEKVKSILGIKTTSAKAQASAAVTHISNIVRVLHDKDSRLLETLDTSLLQGKLCVFDLSQLKGRLSLLFSGLILKKIFRHNQEEFTKAKSQTIPTLVVIEEAQSVLDEKSQASEPFISWVKEGRKYDLGALLITQQPGSVPTEILSQGDNWFIFHLLSATDLLTLKKANAHFSDDLLSSILNEPIPGQGVFWSSVGGKPYPISFRAMSFEKKYAMRDPEYNRPARTSASENSHIDEPLFKSVPK